MLCCCRKRKKNNFGVEKKEDKQRTDSQTQVLYFVYTTRRRSGTAAEPLSVFSWSQQCNRKSTYDYFFDAQWKCPTLTTESNFYYYTHLQKLVKCRFGLFSSSYSIFSVEKIVNICRVHVCYRLFGKLRNKKRELCPVFISDSGAIFYYW